MARALPLRAGSNVWALRLLVVVSGMMAVAVSGIAAHVMARTTVRWLIWCIVATVVLCMMYAWWKITGWLLACKMNPDTSGWQKPSQYVDNARRDEEGGEKARKFRVEETVKLIDEKILYNRQRRMEAHDEVIVCIKGLVAEFSDAFLFETRPYGEVVSEVLETLADICSINDGKMESVSGSGVFMSFSAKQRTVDAMCVAMFSTKIQTADNFTITAGITRGFVTKGAVGAKSKTWQILAGGAAHIADYLASATVTFGCAVLFAGEIDNQVIFSYAFAQVDLIVFENCPGGRMPVYAITEGAGVDADISLMWVNVSRGDFDGASVLLDQHPEEQIYITKMKLRLKHIFNLINQTNASSYDVSLAVSTFLNVHEEIKRTNRMDRFSLAGPANDHHAFLVLRMAGNPETPRKLRESMACFCMSVERHHGTVELLLSDRFIARWEVKQEVYDDAIACSAHLLKVFDGWACGLGLAQGRGETIEHRDLTVVCCDARARAECLAMLCYKFKLATVADLEVTHLHQQQQGKGPVAKGNKAGHAHKPGTTLEWRIIAFEGTFFIPKEIASQGLVELHRPSNIVYLRAMIQMGEKLWATARELLHQYMEIDEHDTWARELLSVVTTAAHQESVGTRGSDDPLHFIIQPAGGEFFLTESRWSQLRQQNMGLKLKVAQDAVGDGAVTKPERTRRKSSLFQVSGYWDTQLRDRKKVREYLGFHAGMQQQVREEEGCRITLPDILWFLHLGCLIADILLVPARSTVRHENVGSVHDLDWSEAYGALLIFGYVCDVMQILGIVRTFYEPYTSQRGILITDRQAIKEHYLTSKWFILDVVTCFPWELLWMAVDTTAVTRWPWLRVNRVAKIARYPGCFFKVQNKIAPDAHPVAVKLFVNLSMVWYGLYCLGCVWDVVLYTDGSQEEYFNLEGYPQNYSAAHRVLFHFHWALRGFAGYGQKWPTTDRVHAMCVVNVVIGIAIFATVIAYLQSMASMTHDEVFYERLDSIVAVAEHRRLDYSTVADILRYQRMLWAKTKQVYEGQFDELKDELPEELVGELAYFANIRAIDNIEMLRTSKDAPFVAVMISNMTLRFGAPGEQLLSRGDAFREDEVGIYFIYKGRAVATVEGHEIEVVEEGGYWGEISCLLGLPQAADLHIRSYSEMYYLPMAGFKKVLSEFPSYTDMFVHSASRRRELIRGILAQTQELQDEEVVSEADSSASSEQELFDEETSSRIRTSFCQKIVDSANAHSEMRRRSHVMRRVSFGGVRRPSGQGDPRE
eukprot:TRINITY_DN17141_c0_g1_i1.p1 TRINITY_DN17141_c0_g1~~TRINITY_DN17141_c0_g1_i1.p1  ORF type:complete len:1265 (+),score=434.69 TRINITY_DN17141_c0_g1_i1:138-3932(+)